MSAIGSLLLAVVPAAPSLATDAVPEPLRRCAEIEDDAQRLACYDDYVAREGAEPVPAEAARPAEAPAQAAPGSDEAASAEARFGLPEDDDGEELNEISATIVDIVVRANRERIFTLDNGQVWVEDGPRPSIRLKVGDTVRIRAGALGSYRLFGPRNRALAVDRAR